MFIQVVQGKTSDPEGLRTQFDKWAEELAEGAEGFAGGTVGITEDGDFVALARFESEEAAAKNSERPEQSAWWEETAKHVDGEATFRDCTDVDDRFDYTEDTAGFVQVIQGRSADPERQKAMEAEVMPQLRDLRTELLGSVTAWDGDNFVAVAYFASEHTAREGEGKVLPDDLQAGFNEWQSLLEDVTYLDLKEPLLLTP
jgi:hypothetical protein